MVAGITLGCVLPVEPPAQSKRRGLTRPGLSPSNTGGCRSISRGRVAEHYPWGPLLLRPAAPRSRHTQSTSVLQPPCCWHDAACTRLLSVLAMDRHSRGEYLETRERRACRGIAALSALGLFTLSPAVRPSHRPVDSQRPRRHLTSGFPVVLFTLPAAVSIRPFSPLYVKASVRPGHRKAIVPTPHTAFLPLCQFCAVIPLR